METLVGWMLVHIDDIPSKTLLITSSEAMPWLHPFVGGELDSIVVLSLHVEGVLGEVEPHRAPLHVTRATPPDHQEPAQQYPRTRYGRRKEGLFWLAGHIEGQAF